VKRKKKRLRHLPPGPFDSDAKARLRPHPYVNEVWATLECWHPCFFRFYSISSPKIAMLRCCECEYVYYPVSTRVDSITYAIGAAL
jgi:hypothetical protein